MSSIYRILGQVAPLATTLTTAYTVTDPVRSTVISSITVANRGAATSFRIAIRKAGAAISNEQYIAYDMPIAANDSMSFNIGVTLQQTDVISVYNTLATCSFNVFGQEIQ